MWQSDFFYSNWLEKLSCRRNSIFFSLISENVEQFTFTPASRWHFHHRYHICWVFSKKNIIPAFNWRELMDWRRKTVLCMKLKNSLLICTCCLHAPETLQQTARAAALAGLGRNDDPKDYVQTFFQHGAVTMCALASAFTSMHQERKMAWELVFCRDKAL